MASKMAVNSTAAFRPVSAPPAFRALSILLPDPQIHTILEARGSVPPPRVSKLLRDGVCHTLPSPPEA